MAKVLYKQGTKQQYLNLEEHLETALYFCTDTKELFKGDDLYSDGLRIVKNFESLPSYVFAADGILYFCEDTGCGYVLNNLRNGWLAVIHGVDNETIEVSAKGLLAVKSVPIDKVIGLSDELKTVNERLSSVEKAVVGGVRYCGAVETYEELPVDAAQGDLYEVRADNSEWCYNGEKWFEYGRTVEPVDLSGYPTREEMLDTAELVSYEVSSKPVGTLVNKRDGEIRVMCPYNTEWKQQQSGENSDPNAYYIGFKAYAPAGDIVGFKEDLNSTIGDDTMYSFVDNEFAGIDEYGRKYSIVWLPVAAYNAETSTWMYYGSMSSADKLIGWYYSVEWYDSNGVKVASDMIRINLTNEACHISNTPYYVNEIRATIDAFEESCTWGEI